MLSRCGVSKLSSGNHTVGSREPTKTVFVLVLQRLHCHARFVLAGIVFNSFYKPTGPETLKIALWIGFE